MDSKRDSSASRNRSMSSNTSTYVSPAKASMRFPLSNSDSAVEFAKNIIQIIGALGCILKRHRYEGLLVFFSKLRNIKNQNEKRKVGLCKCLNALKAAYTRIKSTANQRIKEFAQVHPRKNNLLPAMRLNIFQTTRAQSQSIRKSPFTRGKGAELGKIKLIFNEMSADGITMSNLSHYNVTSFLTFNAAWTKLTSFTAKKRKEYILHVFYHKLMKLFISTATPKRIFKMLKKRKIDEMALVLQTLNSHHKDICHMQPSYYVSDSESDESAFRSSGKKIAYYFPSCAEIEEDNETITDPSPRRQVGAFIKRQEMLKKIINKRSLPSSVNNKQLEQFVNFERALLSIFRVFGRATSRQLSASMQEMHRKTGQRQAKQAVLKNLLNQYTKRINQPLQRAFYTWLARTSRDAHEGEFFFRFRQLIESHMRNTLREAFWRLRVSNLDKRYVRNKQRDSQIRAVSLIACFKRIRLNRLQISINKIKEQSARRKKECYNLLSVVDKIAMRNKIKAFHAIRVVGLKNTQAQRVLLPLLIRSYFTKNILGYFQKIKSISNRKQQSIIYANRLSMCLTKMTHRILRLPFSKLQNLSRYKLVMYHQHQHSTRQFAVYLAFLIKSIKLKHYNQFVYQLKSNNDRLNKLIRALRIVARISSKSINYAWKEQIQQAFQKIKNIAYKTEQNQRVQDIEQTIRVTKIFRFKDILATQLIRRMNLSFQKIKAISLKIKSKRVPTAQIIFGVMSSSVLRRLAQGFQSIQRQNQEMILLKGQISQLVAVTGNVYSERKKCALQEGFRAIEENAWMKANQKGKLQSVIRILQEMERRFMREGFNRLVQESRQSIEQEVNGNSEKILRNLEQSRLEGDQPTGSTRSLFGLVTFLKRKMDLQLAGAFSELNLFVYKKNLQKQTAVFHVVQKLEKIICRRLFTAFSCLRVLNQDSWQYQHNGDAADRNDKSRQVQFPEISGMLRDELERIVRQVQGDGASYSTQLIKLQEQINNLCSEQQNHFGSLHSAIKDKQNSSMGGQSDANRKGQELEREQQTRSKDDDQKEENIGNEWNSQGEGDQRIGEKGKNKIGDDDNYGLLSNPMEEDLTKMKKNSNIDNNESVNDRGRSSQQNGSQQEDNEDSRLAKSINNDSEKKSKPRSEGYAEQEVDVMEDRSKSQISNGFIQNDQNNERQRNTADNYENNKDRSRSNLPSGKIISNCELSAFPEEESAKRNTQNQQTFAQEKKQQQQEQQLGLSNYVHTKQFHEDETLQERNTMDPRYKQSDTIGENNNGMKFQRELEGQSSSACSIDPSGNSNNRRGFSEKSVKGGQNTQIPRTNQSQLGKIDQSAQRQQSMRDQYSEKIDMDDPVLENSNENTKHYNSQDNMQQQQEQEQANNSLTMKSSAPQRSSSSSNINQNSNTFEGTNEIQKNSSQQMMPFYQNNSLDQSQQMKEQQGFEGKSNQKGGQQIVNRGQDSSLRGVPAVEYVSQQAIASNQTQEEQENEGRRSKANERESDYDRNQNGNDDIEKIKQAPIQRVGEEQKYPEINNNRINPYLQNLTVEQQQPSIQFGNQQYQQKLLSSSFPASQVISDMLPWSEGLQQQQANSLQQTDKLIIGVNSSENSSRDQKSNTLLRNNNQIGYQATRLHPASSMNDQNEAFNQPLSHPEQSKQLSRQESSNIHNENGLSGQVLSQTGQLKPQIYNQKKEEIDSMPQQNDLEHDSANESSLEEQQQCYKNKSNIISGQQQDTQIITSIFPSNLESPYHHQQYIISKQTQGEQENEGRRSKPRERENDYDRNQKGNDDIEKIKKTPFQRVGEEQQNQGNNNSNSKINTYQQNLSLEQQQPSIQLGNQQYQQKLLSSSSPTSQVISDMLPQSQRLLQQQQQTSGLQETNKLVFGVDGKNEAFKQPLSHRELSQKLSRQGNNNTPNENGFSEQVLSQTGQLKPQGQQYQKGEGIDLMTKQYDLVGYGSANGSSLQEQQQGYKNKDNNNMNSGNDRDTQITTSRFPSNPESPYHYQQQQQQQMPRADNRQQQGQSPKELSTLSQRNPQSSQEGSQRVFDNPGKNYNSNNSNRSNYQPDRFDSLPIRKSQINNEDDYDARKGQILTRKTPSTIFPPPAPQQAANNSSNSLKNRESSESSSSLNIPQIIPGCGLISYLPKDNGSSQSPISQDYKYPQKTTLKDQSLVISSSPHQYKYSSPDHTQDPSFQKSINHLSPIISDDHPQPYSTRQNPPYMPKTITNAPPSSHMQTFGNHRSNMQNSNPGMHKQRLQGQDNIDIDDQLDMFQQHLQRIKLQLQQASKTEDSPRTARDAMKKQLFSHREAQRQREEEDNEEEEQQKGYSSLKYSEKRPTQQGGQNSDEMRSKDNNSSNYYYNNNRDFNEDIILESDMNNPNPSQFYSQSNNDKMRQMQPPQERRRTSIRNNLNFSSERYDDTPADNNHPSSSNYYQSHNPYDSANKQAQGILLKHSNERQQSFGRLNDNHDSNLDLRSAGQQQQQYSSRENSLGYQHNYQSMMMPGYNSSRLDYRPSKSINSMNSSNQINPQAQSEKRSNARLNGSQFYSGDDRNICFQPASLESQTWRKVDNNCNTTNNNLSDVQQFIASRREDRPRPRQTLEVEILEDD